jgi:hypothetical protein
LEQSHRRLVALVGLGLVAAAGVAWALLARKVPPPHTQPVALAGSAHVVVEVRNGSGRRGLARTATRVLRQAGFDVVYFGSASQTVVETEALARRGDSVVAAKVAAALGAHRVRVALDTLLRVDVTVLLGSDYQPPPGIRP